MEVKPGKLDSRRLELPRNSKTENEKAAERLKNENMRHIRFYIRAFPRTVMMIRESSYCNLCYVDNQEPKNTNRSQN